MQIESTSSQLVQSARRIAAEVARPHAADVDKNARFPAEVAEALRQAKLMSCYVPTELGGAGCSITDLAAVSEALAEECASSAMTFAMHQIQVAMLVHHELGSPYFRSYLKQLVEKQNLMGSMTTEVGVGGDMRRSVCGLEVEGDKFKFAKDTTTMSYGAQSDDILASCRRSQTAAPSDQVMVLLHRADYTYTANGVWDTLGLRGTCSPPASVRATGSTKQVLSTPFGDSAALTMVPISHCLWAACWVGIAKGAVARAHAYVRKLAREKPGTTPPNAMRLADATAQLYSLRAHVNETIAEYEAIRKSPDAGAEELSGMRYALKINNLKLSCSQMLFQIVHQAFAVTGIQGFKNDSKFSMGRHLRDALAAGVMIGNDRIAATNASLLLVLKGD